MSFLCPRNPAVYAGIAVLATQALSAAEHQPPRRGKTDFPPGVILDVALVAGGALRGSLVDTKGTELPHRTVIISQQHRVLETRSDARGNFILSGLRPGMYVVAVDGAQQACRLWAPGTAPPSAVDAMLIVAGSDIVRGQLVSPSRRQWLNENAGQIAVLSAFIALPIVYATKPYGS